MTQQASAAMSVGLETPRLAVRDLCVEMRTPNGLVPIVSGLDLSVAPGETVGLVGESGCGKTITSLAIMGLLPTNARSSGEVRLDDTNLLPLPPAELNRYRGVEMAMIFQEPRRSLNPVFTVGDQVAEAVRHGRKVSRKESWCSAVELLDMVGIPDAVRRAEEYPHSFSGGMCQRVMLAMALACDPKLLIADEPTTALDVTVQRQVLELIFEFQARLDLSVLLITHDLGVVAEVCDRAVVMYAGQVIEDAPVMDLFDAPQHPYAAGLLHAMPDPVRHAELMGSIPGTVPSPLEYPDGCRFHPRCPYKVEGICTTSGPLLRQINQRHLTRCARSEDIDLTEAFYA